MSITSQPFQNLCFLAKGEFFDTNKNILASKSIQDLMDEIQIRIRELQRRGIQIDLIQNVIEKKSILSRLIIDKEFRIFLPDYNNKEIILSPLPKAVFLLYLKHPEGIPFKQLQDYYTELLDLYKRFSNRIVERKIIKSIRNITDPTKNSINEKCSRIKAAFQATVDISLADQYYITGKSGEPKKITLPRELVDLQGL